MAKKQYQSQSKNATRSNLAKKKPSNIQRSVRPASTKKDRTEGTAPPVTAAPRASTQTANASHAYVISDLIRTVIIAGISFVILVVLYIVL